MIFVTIGSHEPFDRLIKTVDAWAAVSGRGDELFGQITNHARYLPAHFEWVETLGPTCFRKRCEAADLVVSHAGVGTILTVLGCRTPALLLPRRSALGETRNDHQLATAQRFRDRLGLHFVDSEAELADSLDRLSENGTAAVGGVFAPLAGPQLTEALRAFIFADSAAPKSSA